MNKKFQVVNVATMGFDNHVVTLENEDAEVKLRIKDQTAFDQYAKGDEVVITFGEGSTAAAPAKTDVKKKSAPKKQSTKKKA